MHTHKQTRTRGKMGFVCLCRKNQNEIVLRNLPPKSFLGLPMCFFLTCRRLLEFENTLLPHLTFRGLSIFYNWTNVLVCDCVCLIYLSSEGEVEEQGSESFWERERDKKGMGMRWFVYCTIAVTEALLCGKRRWMDEKAITGLVFRESGSLWNKVEIDSTGERNLIHRKGKRVFIVCITNFVCGHWISCTRGRGDGLLRMELSKDHKKH